MTHQLHNPRQEKHPGKAQYSANKAYNDIVRKKYRRFAVDIAGPVPWRGKGALLALAIAASAGVHSQETPLGFSFGPGEVVEHDSNILRLPSSQTATPIVSDTLYETFLAGTFHQIYSRQDLAATATIGRVLYQNLRQFDLTVQDIRATLKSSLPYNIDSQIDVTRSAQLAHFYDLQTPVRDVIARNQADARIDFPLQVDWRAVVGATGAQTRNSNTSLQTQNLDSSEVNGGIRFAPSTGNHVDFLLRSAHGTYPNGSPDVFISPGYHDRGADLRVDWTFSGESHAYGRAGFVQRKNDTLLYLDPTTFQIQQLNRDFSGPAYDFTYVWQTTAISKLTFYAMRQTGAAGDDSYLSAVNKTIRLTPSYQVSAKIELDGYYEWSQRNYFSNVYKVVYGVPAGTTRLDHWHNAGVRAIWAPTRWLETTLDLHREARESNISSWTYSNNVASLSAQGTF